MAVEAVVSVVIQKVADMLKGQALTQNKLLVYEVQEIIKSLDSMRDMIIISTKVVNQAEDYLQAVYMVEDGIEKFTLNVVRRKKVFGFLTNHIFFFDNLNSCVKIHQKIKRTLMKLKDNEQVPNEGEKGEKCLETRATDHVSFSYSCNEEVMQIVGIKERFQQTKNMLSFCYKEEEMGVFGLKKDVDTLVNHLTNNCKHVVLIAGIGGIGKTTLVRAIYKHGEIKQRFQFRVWVSVLEDYTTKDILLSVLKAIDSVTDKGSNKDDDDEVMKYKVSEYLKNKRYLIILDGANSYSHILDDIKEAFPDVKNGSKLVLTASQNIEMETTQDNLSLHCMMPLSEDDSWKMFTEKVGREKSLDLVTDESKQAILLSCKGLPLNIVLLAGLFSMTDTNRWSKIFSRMKSSMDVLSLCYNDLSDNLKVCLLYLVLFPKEYDIPVRRLLRLWLAEGFVKQTSTEEFLEDTAQTYFDELVNRNMIQISKLRSDNSPRRCFVLGVLHDYLLLKAKETNLFHTYGNLINCENDSFLNVRRMVEYESPKKEQVNNNLFLHKKSLSKSSSFNPSKLRSYMSFNHQQPDYMQANRIGIFLGNIINDGLGLLRVLDLEGVYKPILPENIGNLCNLRYLGLRLTYLDSLPPSVGELTHLETLDLKHTCIDELPSSIWRLKKLHHLNLNEIRPNAQLHSSLRLLTLWGLFLDKKVPIKDGLDKLKDLRELGITFFLTSNYQEDLMNWIADLKYLRSLRLRSKDNLGHPSDLMFKSMLNLGQLSHLNLLGRLEKLPDYNEFPPTLKVLTLSISMIKSDPMKTIGQLPCLTVLRLLGQSYIGKEMVCVKGGFGQLKVLKMWMLKELESWVVEEGSMESLKHLEIRCCEKLHSIPTTVLQQSRLENLVLTGMPDAFATDVERLKSDHTSMTIKQWKFPPLPVSS